MNLNAEQIKFIIVKNENHTVQAQSWLEKYTKKETEY